MNIDSKKHKNSRGYFLLLHATAAFRTQLISHPQENPTTFSKELYGSYVCCTEVDKLLSCFGIELRSSFTLLEEVPGARLPAACSVTPKLELGAQHLFMAGINCLNRSINLQPSEVSRVDVPLIKANILLRQKGKAPLEQQSLGAGRTWIGARDFTSSFLLNESPGTWALCG